MRQVWLRAISIRGRLVLWYLAVLAVLLLALGIFQSLILGNYLRSSLAESMRDAARSELAVLGPCYVRSGSDLTRNAQNLARLLGSREIGAKVVTPSGAALADGGLGPPGATRPLRLSATAIHRLIQSASPSRFQASASFKQPPCHPGKLSLPPRHKTQAAHMPFTPNRFSLTSGNMLLVAVPIGFVPHPFGYAILGQSLDGTDATVHEVDLIFGLGAGIAILLALLVALPTINTALQPLKRVTGTAEAIAAGDLQQRANLKSSAAEVKRLGEAFDTMVDRLQSALSESKASEERMRQFLADASHELRTPITVLRGTSQVLLREGAVTDPETKSALSDIHEESVRLSRLVDALLDLSRIDARQPLKPQAVDLIEFMREFVDHHQAVWPTHTLDFQSDSAQPLIAFADADALTHIVRNLVDNAARYTKPKGAISLSAQMQNRTVSVIVRDDGPGMKPEDARHVFDRFYRTSSSRSRDDGGTGLGLSIVLGLVERSGGDIDLETGPDRGTTVTVTLPRARS